MKTLLPTLERYFGNLSALSDTASRTVLVSPSIQPGDLEKVFTNAAAALHVPNFYPPSNCERVRQQLATLTQKYPAIRQNWSVSHQANAQETSDVDSVGVPFNVANSLGRAAKERYFQNSLESVRYFREGRSQSLGETPAAGEAEESLPLQLGPVDKIRLELDENWVDGCTVATEKQSGKKYSPGICRIMTPTLHSTKRGFIHVDDLNVMKPTEGLFSYNIYIQQPEIGGEVNIWPLSIRTRGQFYRNAATLSLLLLQDESAQEYLYRVLPPPTTVRVKAGDLLILSTQRPHAVKKPLVGKKERISFQGFIQYKRGQPLLMEV